MGRRNKKRTEKRTWRMVNIRILIRFSLKPYPSEEEVIFVFQIAGFFFVCVRVREGWDNGSA